MKKIRKDK